MKVIEYPKGIAPLDISITSIDRVRNKVHEEGRNGYINFGSYKKDREITLRFYLKSSTTNSFRLLRNELFALFGALDHFYVSEEYDPGKRYKVSVDNKIVVERGNQREAVAEIECTTVELPFGESIGTSRDIEINGISANSSLWGFGMGLLSDIDSQKYKHDFIAGKTVKIYNPGIEIHPFEQQLKIYISKVTGSKTMFQITNHTNGSKARVNKGVGLSDTIVYDGPNVTINDLQALRDTRKDFIELSPGWNNLQIFYCDSATIEFDFRFYYD